MKFNRFSNKGQMFTLVVISIIFLMFLSYEIYSFVNEKNSVRNRIRSMETYMTSLEENLNRQFYILGFRIVFLAENEISRTGNYITNFNSFFNEAAFNGTIEGNVSDIMVGAKIQDIVNSNQYNANKLNLNVSLTNMQVSLIQLDAWNLGVLANFSLKLSDTNELAEWNKNSSIAIPISIIGLEDPVYIVSTRGKISQKINQSENAFGLSNFSNLVSRHLYFNNPDAPNFLMRIEGNLTSSIFGVESFVNTLELSEQGMSVQSKSVADYIYFSALNPSASNVDGMPAWFLLDEEHRTYYLT